MYTGRSRCSRSNSNSNSNDVAGNEVASTSPQTEPQKGHPSSNNGTTFHVNQLSQLYKNLEGRVSRLEAFLNSQMRTNSVESFPFDPNSLALPSENSVASSGSFVSNSSSESVNSLSSGASALREISKTDLDEFCLPLLQRKAFPSVGELNSIVFAMKATKYPDIDNRTILSKLREWFRRKREYMSQRIINSCTRYYRNFDCSTAAALQALKIDAKANTCVSIEIARESNLEVIDFSAASEFCLEKILAHLDHLEKETCS